MIHEFDPVVYPYRLWVSVKPTFEDVSEKFWGLNDSNDRIEIEREWFDSDRHTIARTGVVSDKQSGWIGNIVYILNPKQVDTKTICHEAAHCADFITESFGITNGDFVNGEAYAYLIGWIAECIEKVKKGTNEKKVA